MWRLNKSDLYTELFFCSLQYEKRHKTKTNMCILFVNACNVTVLLKHSFNKCLDCILLNLP
jgi:hypothetical protein